MINITPETFFVDKRSKTPLIDQLRDDIIRLIINQTLLPGDTMPKPHTLAAYFESSPSDMETLYAELHQRGYLSQASPFTIVYEQKPNYLFMSKSTIATALGKIPSDVTFQTLATRRYFARPEAAEQMRFKPNEAVLEIERMFCVNAIPQFFATIMVPLSLFPNFEAHYDDALAIWDIYKEQYQLTIDNRHSELRVVALNQKVADVLRLPHHAPSYQLLAHVYDQSDRCIEYYEVYTPSHYFFQVKTDRETLKKLHQKP
jgi:DNA-binding GntR family transcriptional regulator